MSRSPQTARLFEAFGESKTARQWAEDPRCIVSLTVLKDRLRKTKNCEAAITSPVRTLNNKPIPELPVENPVPSRTYVNASTKEPLGKQSWTPVRAGADDHLQHRSVR